MDKVYAIGRRVREVHGWARSAGIDREELVVLTMPWGLNGLHDVVVHVINGGPESPQEREYLNDGAAGLGITLVQESW